MEEYPFERIEYDEDRAMSLRDAPGIYAWYRDISSVKFPDNPDIFFQKLMDLLESPLSDTFTAQAGYLYSISVTERARGISEKKKRILRGVLDSTEGREFIRSHLKALKSFLSPLYIGKAESIRDRVGQHVTGESLLKNRLSKAGIEIENCYLSVVYVDEISDIFSEDLKHDEVVVLLEDLITRLGPSAFVRRPG